ncbi:lipase family protein [Cohnella mopanensis]|uniref:lipase family protein n=1 Tax=Cohnella mopanensis TaxID=2911966 RepID=UPI0034E26C63
MSGFDNRTAIFLASVCSQTYEHFNDPNGQFVIPYSYEMVEGIRARSLTGVTEKFGFILQSDSHVIVAFRGTSTTTDWISDAMASQVKFKSVPNTGLTHRGFSNIYYSARESILTVLDGLSADKTLYVTGHSLGGALATLCALDVAVNSPFTFPIVYTFGSPRVGDPKFTNAYGETVDESFRVQNRYDVVTHLPPKTYKPPRREKTFSYKHVSQAEGLVFHNGSVPGNHVISSYYEALARRDPLFAEQLSLMNPGLCPSSSRYVFKQDHSLL